MSDPGGGRNSLPCFRCGKEMRRVTDGGHELQPEHGLHFDTTGAYGTTAFDPMDGSSLNIIVCDECIVAGAREGRVMLDQKYIGIGFDPSPDDKIRAVFACGYYVPDRQPVLWDPDADYPEQEPLLVELEEVAEAQALHSTVMWKASAVQFAREFLAAEKEQEEI